MNLASPILDASLAGDPSADARFFEYSQAADPIRPSLTPPIPASFFPPSLYAEGPSRVVPLDLSEALKCEGPATGPGLCAHFVRIAAGDSITLDPVATSMIAYVIRGAGRMVQGDTGWDWGAGDFFSLPGDRPATLTAVEDAALYYVNDAPLLRYLGCGPTGRGSTRPFIAPHRPMRS
jgi:hypothetical protein